MTFFETFMSIASAPRVKFVHERPLNASVVYNNDRSKAVVPVLFLFCVAL